MPPHSGDAQSMHTARVKSGGDGLPTMDEIDEKKRIAEEEEKEKDRITPVSLYPGAGPRVCYWFID